MKLKQATNIFNKKFDTVLQSGGRLPDERGSTLVSNNEHKLLARIIKQIQREGTEVNLKGSESKEAKDLAKFSKE